MSTHDYHARTGRTSHEIFAKVDPNTSVTPAPSPSGDAAHARAIDLQKIKDNKASTPRPEF